MVAKTPRPFGAGPGLVRPVVKSVIRWIWPAFSMYRSGFPAASEEKSTVPSACGNGPRSVLALVVSRVRAPLAGSMRKRFSRPWSVASEAQ